MGNAVQRLCPRRFGGSQEAREPFRDSEASAPGMSTSRERVPVHTVQLVVSSIGPGAYHSSVVVNGEEFSFSDGGVQSAPGLASHTAMAEQQGKDNKPQVIDFGKSHYSGSALKGRLERYFLPGTYDLLRKNCNSFSDVALFYLVHKRMDGKYRSMEKLGSSFSGLVQGFSGGKYTPNPKAADFDIEQVIKEIDPEKVWSTPGHATGGAVITDPGAMREARLAALSRVDGNAV